MDDENDNYVPIEQLIKYIETSNRFLELSREIQNQVFEHFCDLSHEWLQTSLDRDRRRQLFVMLYKVELSARVIEMINNLSGKAPLSDEDLKKHSQKAGRIYVQQKMQEASNEEKEHAADLISRGFYMGNRWRDQNGL